MTATATKSSPSTDNKWIGLLAWLAFTFLASATAVFVSTGDWYAALNKPTWNPPSWIFGPVWTTLYVMMAVSAWLVWQRGGWKLQAVPLTAFVIQWTLNLIWTPLFFGAHQLGWALLDIILLWLAIVTTIVLFTRVSRFAAGLLIPYLLWVSFAAFLNFTIWRMNLGG